MKHYPICLSLHFWTREQTPSLCRSKTTHLPFQLPQTEKVPEAIVLRWPHPNLSRFHKRCFVRYSHTCRFQLGLQLPFQDSHMNFQFFLLSFLFSSIFDPKMSISRSIFDSSLSSLTQFRFQVGIVHFHFCFEIGFEVSGRFLDLIIQAVKTKQIKLESLSVLTILNQQLLGSVLEGHASSRSSHPQARRALSSSPQPSVHWDSTYVRRCP